MFYSFKNCQIAINDVPYYVNNMSLSARGNIDPAYAQNSKFNINYVPSDGIGGTCNISYVLTGVDNLSSYISFDDEPIKVNLGGIYFQSGYLKQYSFNLEPNTPVIVNASIIFFDSLSGDFTPIYQSGEEKVCLNVAEVNINNFIGSETRDIRNITKLSYNYDVNIEPQYVIGKTIPSRIVFGERAVNVDIESEKTFPIVSVSGNLASLRIKLRHPENANIYQNFDVKGPIYQKTYNASVGNILVNSLSIKQNNLENFNLINNQNIKKTKIYNFFPHSGFYGTLVTISGDNLNSVDYISLLDNAFVSFSKVNNNQINFNIPGTARSGPLKLYTESEIIESLDNFVIGGVPIEINNISAMTGLAGQIITISGKNFYEISDVLFNSGTESSEFTILSPTVIQTVIPQGASIGNIIIKSSLFDLSGTNTGNFIPSPYIYDFGPISGLSGQNIILSGFGFNSVTGIKINNLPNNNTAQFSVIDNTGISIIIPSGNTKGNIQLYGYSGLYTISQKEFYPYSIITGLFPTSGRTGDFIRISGKNLIPELLSSSFQDIYNIAFQGNVTGYFSLQDNNTVLTGQIPSGAISGQINIVSPSLDKYPSNYILSIRDNQPSIQSWYPISGKRGETISVYGDSLYNLSSVILTGYNTGYNYSIPSITTSLSKNVINLSLPIITGGRYDLIINTIEGNVTGSGIYVLENPYVSGISITTGSAGSIVSMSGLNIYPELTQVWIDESGYMGGIISGSGSYNNNYVSFYVPNNIASGKHNIIIYNSVSSGSGNILFNYVPSPIISGFYPTSGQWGDTIKLTGLYFASVNNVGISNISGSINYTKIADTGIELIIPNNTNADFITLYTQFNYGISNNKLNIISPLVVISGFSPLESYYRSGVIVSGNYFNTLQQIQFSGITGGFVNIDNFTGINNTGLYFTIPQGIISNKIRFINNRGITYTTTNLNIISGARIDFVSIQTGFYGLSGYVSGQYLSGSSILFDSPYNITQTVENIVVQDTGIYFRIPYDTTSSQIIVQGRNQQYQSSTGNITILPTITGISGNLTYATGSYITITGINSYEITGKLGISGNNGNIYNIADLNEFSGIYRTGDTAITTKINSNFAGTGKLFLISSKDYSSINNISGSITNSYISNIIYDTPITISQPAPTILSIYPTGGLNTTLVTISGNNLFSTLNIFVDINNTVNQATIYSANDREIKFYPPVMNSGTGFIYLTTPFGTATTSPFRLLEKLYISGYSPQAGHTGDYIRITGSGFLTATGVTFGGVSANFVKINELNTCVISGIVPTGFDCCSQDIQICVRNEGDSDCL